MIRYKRTVCNLRTADWTQVDYRSLRDRILEEHRTGEDRWRAVPWQNERGQFAHRSFLLMSDGGCLYAIFIRRTFR